MSLTTKVLIGLAAGVVVGIALSASQNPDLLRIGSWVEPIGTLFINAIRMTVIPLVVSSLVVGVTSAPDLRSVGRVGWRAIVTFVVLVFASATFAAIVAQPILALSPLDPATTAALRAQAETSASAVDPSRVPRFAQWVTSLVPSNPIRAAAEDAMLPLIIFTLAFAVALLKVAPERRAPVVGFFQGLFDAMLTLVRWVLLLAPIGVFALTVPIAQRMGLAAAGELVRFIVLVCGLAVAFAVLVLYPAAVLIGRVPLGAFARAALPGQAVAFSSRSSLAALPAMMEGAAAKLHLPPAVTSFFLPLAASMFRVGSGVGITTGVLFVARLYGVELSVTDLATVVLIVVLTSFSVPGIPFGSILVMVPALLAVGVPAAGMGILLSVDTIPDMFRTATNVTGHMAAATIVARGTADEPPRT